MYVPHVGHATWLSLGCWHCGHVESDAAVVFHMLRRERVFERDIFRFGTGTVIVLNLDEIQRLVSLIYRNCQNRAYPGQTSAHR